MGLGSRNGFGLGFRIWDWGFGLGLRISNLLISTNVIFWGLATLKILLNSLFGLNFLLSCGDCNCFSLIYADRTYDLGSTTLYWNKVYATNIGIGTTGSTIGDDIVTLGSIMDDSVPIRVQNNVDKILKGLMLVGFVVNYY